jgi:hypothetical protein
MTIGDCRGTVEVLTFGLIQHGLRNVYAGADSSGPTSTRAEVNDQVPRNPIKISYRLTSSGGPAEGFGSFFRSKKSCVIPLSS